LTEWLEAHATTVKPKTLAGCRHDIEHYIVPRIGRMRLQAEERLAAGSAWTDSGGLVFVTKWGEPLYPDTVTALMTKLINRHNRSATQPTQLLPHTRLHDQRHLHMTTLLLAGVPVHVVAARLGHADPAVTLRVYSHVLREHAAGIGDIFAQAVNGSR
jgi:integrase